jgi:ubiquinone/menaquinone biosynthesis C-methylase UbiE
LSSPEISQGFFQPIVCYVSFILLYYGAMSRERLPRNPLPLTPREKLWIENFQAAGTPASLRLADDYIKSLRPGDTILEVGCAWGRIVSLLANDKGIVGTGIDINDKEIKWAEDHRVKDHSVQPETEFKVMNGKELEFPDDSFDSAVMVGVIGGIEPEERKYLLQEAYRVIKPGGTVAVAEFKMNADDPQRRKKYEEDEAITGEWGSKIIRRGNKILFIGKHFIEKELIELLSDAGFSSIQSKEHSIEGAGIGDGIIEVRQQYTVWGIKPRDLL